MNNRVLIVAEHDLTSKGGIQKNMARITTHLSGEFLFDAVVYTNMSEDEKRKFKCYQNIYCIPCDCDKGKLQKLIENITRPLRIFINANRIIRKGKYGAIHCHDTQKAPIFLWVAKRKGVPIRIMHCHNPITREPEHGIRKLYFDCMRSLVNPCSNVKFGPSRDACISIFRDQADKSFVVNVGLDLSSFDPSKYEKEPKDTIDFIHVGRFTYQKNHEFLLKVFALIRKEIANARLVLIGWGVLEQNIRQEIESLGIQDIVEILPGDSDIPECMSKADYMVFPSRYEGLGRVLIEAQSMGIMCFASDCIPRETDLGLCDYISLNDDPDAWAKHIIQFIKSNSRQSRELNKKLQSAFDINSIVKKFAEIYRGEHCE